ncbi:glycosyltransferase family 4 protein [Gulosibacter sediminis]|uniref:glycosyltransferase family 4 protein n=1 Tax=Gulosibacter sediminis TaxID=1729695 RepID=UPI0024AE4B10|nr:glycosyltransferase family 4 protein [Gulosibacter sediminis]
MRVLLLTHYFAPEDGAPQRRWGALTREFVERGHEVAVITPPPHYPSGKLAKHHRRTYRAGSHTTTEHGVEVFRSGWLPHRGDIITRTFDHTTAAASTARRAAQLIKKGRIRPDITVATAPAIETIYAGNWLGRKFSLPVITEMRDAWPDLVTYTPGLANGRGPVAMVKRRIHESVTRAQLSAGQVVTTTSAFAGVLEERGVEHLEIIRNGTVPETYEQVPARDADHPELRVLYMGNLGRSQGLDLIIRAAAILRQQDYRLAARIVGAGHEAPALRRLNAQLGEPVEILDRVPPNEVVHHYAWADSTIVSLRDWEPFLWTIPSKLYELLSTGRHITGILAGESAGILLEARAGTVVQPGNVDDLVGAWKAFIEQPERLEIGDTGQRWAREHVAYSSLATRYLEILERVLDDHAPGARA